MDTLLSVADELQFIHSFPERGLFLVAESAGTGRLAGFTSVEPFATYASALSHVGVVGTYVDPTQLRRGTGRALASELARRAPASGYSKFFTYIRADNLSAIAFYQEMGFKVVGTAARHAKIGDAYIDELIVEKLLLS